MKRISIILLSLILIISMTAADKPLVVYADEDAGKLEKDDNRSSDSSNEKKQKEQEINQKINTHKDAITDAEAEKEKIQDNINNVQKIVDGLESQKGNIEAYVSELDKNLNAIQSEINDINEQMDAIQEEIDNINAEIAKKKDEIEKAEAKVEEAKAQLAAKYAETCKHIKYMYQTRKTTYFDVLFQSDGVKDFLNRAEYVNSMAEYDNEQLEEFAKAKAEYESEVAVLNEEKVKLLDLKDKADAAHADLEDKKAVVDGKKKDVAALISVKESEINAYEADISSKEAQIKEYKDMIAAQDAIIRSLEAEIARSERELSGEGEEGQARRTYDGGKFAFPAPSYTRISDDYGNRIHPTLGVQQFHNGVDLAAPSGSPILAAYDGTVIAAAYSATMGNYIMIDHGDSLFTIYMHASSLLVSKGASVSRGQKIALVGSTGRSTGPHLHFSVRSNGNYVSPWNYLK